jgi:hypothetical protein
VENSSGGEVLLLADKLMITMPGNRGAASLVSRYRCPNPINGSQLIAIRRGCSRAQAATATVLEVLHGGIAGDGSDCVLN